MLHNRNSKFIFFHTLKDKNSWCSNWYPCSFTENDITFSSVEQYLMYYKAKKFNDSETAQKILETDNPEEIKELGRQVKNYIDSVWASIRYSVCYNGNKLKFTQNEHLHKMLLNTDGEFAEASQSDKIWGIGLAITDPRVSNKNEWNGLNYLGLILTQLRDEMRK